MLQEGYDTSWPVQERGLCPLYDAPLFSPDPRLTKAICPPCRAIKSQWCLPVVYEGQTSEIASAAAALATENTPLGAVVMLEQAVLVFARDLDEGIHAEDSELVDQQKLLCFFFLSYTGSACWHVAGLWTVGSKDDASVSTPRENAA